MKTLIMIFFYAFMLIGGISISIGFDLKKWYSWLIVAYGFTIGFLMGLVWVDVGTAVMAGILLAVLTLASGATVHSTRQKYKRALDFRLQSQEQEEHYPLMTRYLRFLKKIFHL